MKPESHAAFGEAVAASDIKANASIDSHIIIGSNCPKPDCGTNPNFEALERIVHKIRGTGPYEGKEPMHYSGNDVTNDVIGDLYADDWFIDDGLGDVKNIQGLAQYLRVPEDTAKYTLQSRSGCWFFVSAVADYIEEVVIPEIRLDQANTAVYG